METQDIWQGLIGWIVVGFGGGFFYAWRRLSKQYEQACETINSIPEVNEKDRAIALRYQLGLRLGSGIVFGMIGAVIGLAVWSLGYLITLIAQ
ncbi:MAG: hypothetical protein KF714_10705 [Parvibaculum sp.]|nr:hypothetical protein [Parvibaculum sp.]